MRFLRNAVLVGDAVSLLVVLLIRLAFPMDQGGNGEGRFWLGLLLAYALLLLFALQLLLNVVYVVTLGIMRGRYDNQYRAMTRVSLVLLPAAAFLVLIVGG